MKVHSPITVRHAGHECRVVTIFPELAADDPSHVAAAWLGHSTLVAEKHDWTVTEADDERASRGSGAEFGARAA